MYGGRKKPRKSKTENQLGGKIINTFKDRIFRNIKNLFEQEDGGYCKSVRVVNFYGNNYIDYESKGNKNKSLSIKEYLDEITPYLKKS